MSRVKKVWGQIFVAFVTLVGLPVWGENLYLRAGATGAETGGNWNDAWSSVTRIKWGEGHGQLGPGDTLFVAVGTYGTLTVEASGNPGNYISVRAAQDAYTGLARFGGVDMNAQNYISMDGNCGGNTNFLFVDGISGQAASWCKWSYFKYTNAVVDLRYASNNELSHYLAVLTSGTTLETTLYGIASRNTNYDQTLIHHGKIIIPGQINNGNGPDGVQTGTGFTWSNMIFQAVVGSYSGGQHQDLIQCFGDKYLKVVGCEFIDSGDSQIDLSNSGNVASTGHYRIWNNVFRRAIPEMGTVMIRNYTDGEHVISGYNDFHMDNNTFVDGARTASSYGAAIRLQAGSGNTTASDCSIRNNIIYNCGSGWAAVLVEGVTPNWNFANNLLNAGIAGNVSTSGWTQQNGQTNAPTFAGYAAYGMDNNLRLLGSDSAARDKGVNLSAFFNEDRDGVARGFGAGWDIGAYEYTTTTGN